MDSVISAEDAEREVARFVQGSLTNLDNALAHLRSERIYQGTQGIPALTHSLDCKIEDIKQARRFLVDLVK